jgi:phospholipid/cholesterol/gamma-HCH transport system ATP-binding protein
MKQKINEKILEITNLKAGYGQNIILENVSFHINKGERFVVLGESGCGKSTLLKAIIGLNPPLFGTVKFQNKEITYPLPENSDFYRHIGILYQNSALLNSMTLLENVMLPINMHFPNFPSTIAKDIAKEKLSMVHLYKHKDKYPTELSGGMKKRGALARAMVLDPKIIFFDEPQAGLDPVTAFELDNLFVELNEEMGITFFTVTHELLSIKRAAEKILMLADKKVVFFGTLKETLESEIPNVKRFFNVDNPNYHK